jgi:hypothetical protein
MLINVVPYDKDKADPIINSIPLDVNKGQYFEHWYMQKMHMVKYPGLSSKQIFKYVFGQQLTCVIGWYRNWVWTFSNDTRSACVYCMVDKRGVHWEMDVGSDLRGVINLRDEIERRLLA